MVGVTKAQNNADRERFSTFEEIGCIPHWITGWAALPQAQHVTEGGRRLPDEHQHTYPCCPWHHQGLCFFGLTVGKMKDRYGPSFKHHKSEYLVTYGSEDDLVLIASAASRRILSDRRQGIYRPEQDVGVLVRQLHREIVLGQKPSDAW